MSLTKPELYVNFKNVQFIMSEHGLSLDTFTENPEAIVFLPMTKKKFNTTMGLLSENLSVIQADTDRQNKDRTSDGLVRFVPMSFIGVVDAENLIRKYKVRAHPGLRPEHDGKLQDLNVDPYRMIFNANNEIKDLLESTLLGKFSLSLLADKVSSHGGNRVTTNHLGVMLSKGHVYSISLAMEEASAFPNSTDALLHYRSLKEIRDLVKDCPFTKTLTAQYELIDELLNLQLVDEDPTLWWEMVSRRKSADKAV